MRLLSLFAAICFSSSAVAGDDSSFVLTGTNGPGKGKSIVLVSGDEEYRSEEMLPALARILAVHHGFSCTTLFAIDPKDGTINPNVTTNIPGLSALKNADLLILFTRFRNLPDDQMKYIVDYVESGKPVIGIRTATHAFAPSKDSKYAKYHWQGKEKGYEQGFGRQVLGETWIAHHGKHGQEGTRGILAKGQESQPILKGIKDGDVFGKSDVYRVRLPLPGDCVPLVYGQCTKSLDSKSDPVAGKENDPMMPVAWTKTYTGTAGKKARVFATTIGCAQDFSSEGYRRLLTNAAFWCLGMESQITDTLDVDLVGEYKPSPFKVNGFRKGVKPSDLK
ncbi:MAG TPA: ThuA domain-containing protein [Fimbriiglobus sp.]|jgi:type 1 glutamine amidotransferase